MRTIRGATDLYEVNITAAERGAVSGVVKNATITTKFVVYAKIDSADTTDTLADKLHYAANFHTRVVGYALTNQLCKTTWLAKGQYKLEFILPNNRRYSVSVDEGDADAVIQSRIATAYAYAKGAYSEREMRLAKVVDLRATL